MGKNKKPAKPNPNEHLILGIKRDDAEIKLYEKLLKIRKRKNKSKLSEIFMELDPISGDEGEEGAESEDGGPSGGDDNECELEGSEAELSESNEMDTTGPSEPAPEEPASGDRAKIRRLVRCQLNRLCESQMARCLDAIEELWNEFPRGEVRDVLVAESLNYLGLSCLELAAFVASLHVRLASATSLAAFFLERLVQDLPAAAGNTARVGRVGSAPDSGAALRYQFIAYLTRLETIDCHLILDLMEELVTAECDSARLKLLVDIASIIGFFARKHCPQRCDALVARLRDSTADALALAGDLSELRSLREAVIDKLSTARAKNDVAYEAVLKYRTAMRAWCKKSPQGHTVALRLADLRGDRRARWWLVGSAVDRSAAVVVGNKAPATGPGATAGPTLSPEEERWRKTARDLGLLTEAKQRLFCVLMRGKAQSEADSENAGAGDTVAAIGRLQHEQGAGGDRLVLPETEVAAVLVRCLALETEFCQFYVAVMAGLLEAQRRYRQAVKCAIWDVLAQPRLVDSARHNCGRCLGQLIALAEFPVNCLRKYNFVDASASNTLLMRAVLTEILDESWDDIEDILRDMRKTISTKFVSNLRLFLKKNFKSDDAVSRPLEKALQHKVDRSIAFLHELRKSEPDAADHL